MITIDLTTKAGRIRYMMEASGLNQSQTAEAAKIAKSSMSLILSGRNNPSEQTVTLIAQHCGFDPNWAWTGEGKPRRTEQAAMEAITEPEEAALYMGQLMRDIDPDAAEKICAYIRSLPLPVTGYLFKSLIRWAHDMEASGHADPASKD